MKCVLGHTTCKCLAVASHTHVGHVTPRNLLVLILNHVFLTKLWMMFTKGYVLVRCLVRIAFAGLFRPHFKLTQYLFCHAPLISFDHREFSLLNWQCAKRRAQKCPPDVRQEHSIPRKLGESWFWDLIEHIFMIFNWVKQGLEFLFAWHATSQSFRP